MKRIELHKIINKGDIMTISIIVAGFLLAVFVDLIAFKFIGVSLVILGTVRILLNIRQRIDVILSLDKKNIKDVSNEYQVSEKKDRKAKRTVIENYPSLTKVKQNNEEEGKKVYTKEITDDEGFRIVDDKANDNSNINDSQQTIKDHTWQPSPENINPVSINDDKRNMDNQEFEFEDEFSGLKIIANEKKSTQQSVAANMDEDKTKKQAPSKEEFKFSETGNEDNKYKGKKIEIPLSELLETDPAFGLEPRKEFEYFLNRILRVVRSVTNTVSAVFLLVNSERKELIVEAYDSDQAGNIAVRKRIPFGKDIVSQIVSNMKPEILTEINPTAELELIPYYIRPANTSSFLGMPVFFNNALVGILCADSPAVNAYDTSLVAFFGHFSKLIGGLVKSYTEKYDLMQDSRMLRAVDDFKNILSSGQMGLDELYTAVLEPASKIFDNAVCGIVAMDYKTSKWSVLSVKNNDYPDEIAMGLPISQDSIVYQTLNHNKVISNSPNMSEQTRLFDAEKRLDSGYFVSVPLKSFSGNYGVLFVEGLNSGSLTSYDVDLLKTLASHAGSTIEQLHFSELLTSSALFDPSTGLLNTPAFLQRLNEEVLRSIDFGYPLALCMISIDKYKSLDPELFRERSEVVLMHVIDIIQTKLRPYDVFGRADSNVFGIVLIDTAVKDAKIWAEKLRSDVAISVVKIKSDSFNVTVSIGLAQLGKDEAVDDIVDNTKEMLRLSSMKTNTVTCFE